MGKNASLTYRHTLTGAVLDKAEPAGYLSLTSAFHVVNSPFSCLRSLQSEALFRRSWSCCYDCCSLHSPVLCSCPTLDSFTAREACVCVSPFRALGLSKRGNQILHKHILAFLCLSVCFLFLTSSLPLIWNQRELLKRKFCFLFFFPFQKEEEKLLAIFYNAIVVFFTLHKNKRKDRKKRENGEKNGQKWLWMEKGTCMGT